MLLSLCAATDGLDLSGPGVRTSSIRSCSEVENWFSRSAALTILPWLSLALLGKLLLFSTSLPVVGFFFYPVCNVWKAERFFKRTSWKT